METVESGNFGMLKLLCMFLLLLIGRKALKASQFLFLQSRL
jgi:hypothetical protein